VDAKYSALCLILVFSTSILSGCIEDSAESNILKNVEIDIIGGDIIYQDDGNCVSPEDTDCHIIYLKFNNQDSQDHVISKSKGTAVSSTGGIFNADSTEGNDMCASGFNCEVILIFAAPKDEKLVELRWENSSFDIPNYPPDTTEQMSTKIVISSMYIHELSEQKDTLLLYFELAPGSETTASDMLNWTIICETESGDAGFAEGRFTSATETNLDEIVTEFTPEKAYEIYLDLAGDCKPKASEDHIMVISVVGGGSTYEEIPYPDQIQEGTKLI
jgi:hypothetical protein